MDQFEAVLFSIGLVYGVVTGFEVLSLKPKILIRKIPVVAKSAILILSFVNLVLLLTYALSQTLVPYVIQNPGIVSVLAILGMALSVGFGVSSALTSKALYRRIESFVYMTQSLQNPN